MRALLNYFLTVNAVNLPVSILLACISGLQWLPASLCSFGLCMGFMAYGFFYNNQYYFYHNLGYTRKRLMAIVFIINSIICLPMLITISLF